jgi:flagellar protein FlaI
MFGALDLIVIQGLLYGEGNGFRRCLSLNEISVENGKVVWKPLFSWNHTTDSFDRVYKQSDVFDSIAYQNGWTPNMIEEKLRSRKQVLEELVRTGKTTPGDVEEAIIDHKLQELNNV